MFNSNVAVAYNTKSLFPIFLTWNSSIMKWYLQVLPTRLSSQGRSGIRLKSSIVCSNLSYNEFSTLKRAPITKRLYKSHHNFYKITNKKPVANSRYSNGTSPVWRKGLMSTSDNYDLMCSAFRKQEISNFRTLPATILSHWVDSLMVL